MSRRKRKPAPPRDGSESRMPLLSRLAHGHAQVLVFTLGQLSIKPLGTFLTALVIGITLAMPAGLHLLVKNLGTLSHSWERSLQASLFLKEDVDDAQAQALSQTLRTRPGIDQVRYISRDEAMAQFREHSGFGEALDILETNPLPAVIVVFPDPKQTPATIELLVDSLAKLPEVDQATLDQQWLQRLYAILEIVRRGVLLLAALLAAAVVVVVGNTIRLDIENRRDEIVVMKLVGAPDGFIRRPFLYTGFWYGLSGGLIALILISAALIAVADPAARLSGLYDSDYRVAGLSFLGLLSVLGGGIALGWLGAFWTVSRHLSKIEPT